MFETHGEKTPVFSSGNNLPRMMRQPNAVHQYKTRISKCLVFLQFHGHIKPVLCSSRSYSRSEKAASKIFIGIYCYCDDFRRDFVRGKCLKSQIGLHNILMT